jgi:quercetin dioxygenase-like cupin family protein
MAMAERGIIRQAGEGERVFAMGALVTIMARAEATNGRFSVSEHVVPPGGGPPPHPHAVHEFLYVLEGAFDVWLDDLTAARRVTAGAAILVPPGVAHTTRNAGERAGRLLSLYAPGGDEGFFLAIGTPAADLPALPDLPDMDQPPDLSGLDPARVQALAERYGMRLVPGPAEQSRDA